MRTATLLLLYVLTTTGDFEIDSTAPRGTFELRAVDELGAPLADVRCWISAFEERSGTGWRVVMRTGLAREFVTDAAGRVHFDTEANMRYDVDCHISGRAPSRAYRIEAGEEREVMLRRGLDVSGRVVQRVGEALVPCGPAPVSIRQPNPRGLWFEHRVATDGAGRFEFTGFLPPPEPVRADVGPQAPWEFVYGGALLELPLAATEAIDDVLIEISIERKR